MNEDVKSENLRIHSRADELIACLEGEIAKRDEELAACRVAVENCEVFRARIAEMEDDLKCAHSMLAEVSKAGMALRAELASIKAQGVVRWPDADEIMQMAFEEGQPADDASGYYFELEEFDLFIERLISEVARLNAAPVQQVSVPDGEDWSVFFGYLIDKCEGHIIAEENLQGWLSEMLADPHYCALFRREKTAAEQYSPIAMSIEAAEEEHGSLRAAAKALGIDPGYLSRLKSGEKINPGVEVLRALGLERVTYCRAMLAAAPSPAGVDGLEVVATLLIDDPTDQECGDWDIEVESKVAERMSEHGGGQHELCRLSDATAIIDGLRGEVAELRKRAKTAEREAGSALRTYKGLEKVARVVSDNSDQVCGELNVLRQQFDQHAHRIGELEGLLRHAQKQVPTGSGLHMRIDAALSAGKEGE